jgi:hypothetical protein
MMARRRTPGEVVRQSAAAARQAAETARLHNEPELAERFEQIAAEGEVRARYLDELAAQVRRAPFPGASASTD